MSSTAIWLPARLLDHAKQRSDASAAQHTHVKTCLLSKQHTVDELSKQSTVDDMDIMH